MKENVMNDFKPTAEQINEYIALTGTKELQIHSDGTFTLTTPLTRAAANKLAKSTANNDLGVSFEKLEGEYIATFSAPNLAKKEQGTYLYDKNILYKGSITSALDTNAVQHSYKDNIDVANFLSAMGDNGMTFTKDANGQLISDQTLTARQAGILNQYLDTSWSLGSGNITTDSRDRLVIKDPSSLGKLAWDNTEKAFEEMRVTGTKGNLEKDAWEYNKVKGAREIKSLPVKNTDAPLEKAEVAVTPTATTPTAATAPASASTAEKSVEQKPEATAPASASTAEKPVEQKPEATAPASASTAEKPVEQKPEATDTARTANTTSTNTEKPERSWGEFFSDTFGGSQGIMFGLLGGIAGLLLTGGGGIASFLIAGVIALIAAFVGPQLVESFSKPTLDSLDTQGGGTQDKTFKAKLLDKNNDGILNAQEQSGVVAKDQASLKQALAAAAEKDKSGVTKKEDGTFQITAEADLSYITAPATPTTKAAPAAGQGKK
jgi:hypothetical protein